MLPGDRISVRFFFRRRPGEVIYVPGISKRRGTYEHDGLTWVGVSLPNGWAIGTIVDPETNRLKSSVRFIARGGETPSGADALRRIEAEEAADLRAETEDQTASQAISKPRLVDWIGAALSLVLHAAALSLVIFLFLYGIRFAWKRL